MEKVRQVFFRSILVVAMVAICGEAAILNVPSAEYPTIQAGIDAANDGDKVLLADHIYTGEGNKNLTWDGTIKHITIKSQNGPENCIIDCEGDGIGFNLHATGQTRADVIDGLTITNGADDGAGFDCEDGSSPTIRNCTIRNCSGGSAGGAILCAWGAAPKIVNCRIVQNAATTAGGGIFCHSASPVIIDCNITQNSGGARGGGICCENGSRPTIKGCTISTNTAGEGGGLYCEGSSPIVLGCTLTDNETVGSGDGGGIYCCNSASPRVTNCRIEGNTGHEGGGIGLDDSSAVITDCNIAGNVTTNAGGGINCEGNSSPNIVRCTVKNNTTDGPGGGILCASGASPKITDCLISENTSADAGGGIFCHDASPIITGCTITQNSAGMRGGGICCENGCTATIRGCTIGDNTAVDWGGGVFSGYGALPQIMNCVVSGNSTEATGWGGGICSTESASTEVVNCVIINNQAQAGGGIVVADYAQASIVNCTMTQNRALTGGGIGCSGGAATLVNSILWNDQAPLGPEIYLNEAAYNTTYVEVAYCDVRGGEADVEVESGCVLDWGLGNISSIPLFIDAPSGDYHLNRQSRCVDAGYDSAVPSGVTKDIEGNPRIQGTAVDMGAYEWTPILSVPYYSQSGRAGSEDSTAWCSITSLAMLLKYYGVDYQPWEIADWLDWDPNTGLRNDPNDLIGEEDEPVINDFLRYEAGYESFLWDANFQRIWLRSFLMKRLSLGHPVMVASTNLKHAFVVTGVDEKKAYINDPDGICLVYLGLPFRERNLIGFGVPWRAFLDMVDPTIFNFYYWWSINDTSAQWRQTVSIRCDVTGGDDSALEFRHMGESGRVQSRFVWDGSGSHPGYYFKRIQGDREVDDALGDVAVEDDVICLIANVSNSDQKAVDCLLKVWVENESSATVLGPVDRSFRVDAQKSNVKIPILGEDVPGFWPKVKPNIEDGDPDVDDDDDGLIDEDITPEVWTLEGLSPGRYTLHLRLQKGEIIVDSLSVDFLLQ